MADLERTYTIPLDREVSKVAYYKRAKKATKTVKEFLAKHMRVDNRDLDKVKISDEVNRAIWSRGIKSPPQKITVKATKDKDGIVKVEFAGLPKKFKIEEQKIKKGMEKKAKEAIEKTKIKKVKEQKTDGTEPKVETKPAETKDVKPEKKVKKV